MPNTHHKTPGRVIIQPSLQVHLTQYIDSAVSQPANESTAGHPSHDDSFFAEYMGPKQLSLDAISAGPPHGSFLNIITDNQALDQFGDAAIKAIGV